MLGNTFFYITKYEVPSLVVRLEMHARVLFTSCVQQQFPFFYVIPIGIICMMCDWKFQCKPEYLMNMIHDYYKDAIWSSSWVRHAVQIFKAWLFYKHDLWFIMRMNHARHLRLFRWNTKNLHVWHMCRMHHPYVHYGSYICTLRSVIHSAYLWIMRIISETSAALVFSALMIAKPFTNHVWSMNIIGHTCVLTWPRPS